MINILTKNLTPKTTIPKVLMAEHSERLTCENTLRFSTLIKEVTANQITVDSVAMVDNEYFDIVSVTKEQATDGLRKISVECEQVGYRLNDIAVDFFTQIGTPIALLSEILSGSGFSVGSVELNETITFSLQEQTSKRGLIAKLAAYIGAEVAYSGFSVSLVKHRGQSTAVQLKSGRDILVLKEATTKSGVAYDCQVLNPEQFSLGDNVTVNYPSMEITANLRVVGISHNPYDNRQVSVEISNSPDTLEGNFCRIQTDMVSKSKTYYGIRISADRGFEVERNDGLSKATFNSDTFEMSSLVDGVMTPAIYFDVVERRYKITGIVDVDGEIITNVITAEIANIANAVIEHLDVSELVAEEFAAQTANIVSLVAEQIDVAGLVAEEIAANTANIVAAVIEQLSADEADIVSLTVDKLNTNYGGGKTDYIYIHDEEIELKSGDLIKAQFAFADVGGNKLPALMLGAGDGAGGSRGLIYKHNTGLRLGYITSGGSGENYIDLNDNGITFNPPLTGGGFAGEANFVVLDHMPNESEAENYEIGTLVFVYDPSNASVKFGQSAYDVAKEQGYGGTSNNYNDALGQVGNMKDVLDAILGED